MDESCWDESLVGKAATCSWDSNGSLGAPDQLGCTCRQAADFELFEGVKFKDTLRAKRENDFSSSEVCFGNPWGENSPSCIADDAFSGIFHQGDCWVVLGNFLGQLMVLNSWLFLPDASWTMLTLELAMRKVAEESSINEMCSMWLGIFIYVRHFQRCWMENKHPAGPFAAHLLSSEDMNFMIKNVHLLDGIIPLIIPLTSHYITLKLCHLNPFDVSILSPFTALWILWISNVNICIIPFEGHMTWIFH